MPTMLFLCWWTAHYAYDAVPILVDSSLCLQCCSYRGGQLIKPMMLFLYRLIDPYAYDAVPILVDSSLCL